METFAVYLGKSAAWLTGFALVYLLFLRKERYFILKRIYLITGIVASMILPLITFHYSIEVPAVPAFVPDQGFNPDITKEASQVSQDIMNEQFKFSYNMILLFLYLSGLMFFALRIIKQVKELFNKINNANVSDLGYARLVRASEFSNSFSFFNYIFINPSLSEIEMEPIMKHELVHIKQKHWLDLILVEILCLLQWINPFTWIYSRFIRLNHEYIADQVALQCSSDPAVYKAVLLNQMFSSPVISLSNSFNYSINKTRFDMMKKIIISPWRRLKVLIVLPVFVIVFYAFATPEYQYVSADVNSVEPLTIYEPTMIFQNQVKGIVLNEEGKPVEGVNITATTGVPGTGFVATTDSNGRFAIKVEPPDASLRFFGRGYKSITLKPDYSSEMTVRMVKDPEYKAPVIRPEPIFVIDDVISDKKSSEIFKEIRDEVGLQKVLSPKEAVEKYGEKGRNGVIEITTRKRAAELGIKIPFRRRNPEDFPTFHEQHLSGFTNWVAGQIKYPPEAQDKKLEGWVSVNFTIEKDGTVSNVTAANPVIPILSDEMVKVISSSPRWEPPKNPDALDEPFSTSITLRFKLPEQILTESPFVVVEEMPMYPGGPEALLNFIKDNLKYPETAKADSIQGRVILRFIVNTEGNVEGISVLKGVHPLLDAEAMRLVGSLTGFKPGMQGGKPVNVWYMVPVSFSLGQPNQPARP